MQYENISKAALAYAKSKEGAKITPRSPTTKIKAENRLILNFSYESFAYSLEFIDKLTRGLMPPRWAFKLATIVHNKKIFYKSIYKKYPFYKSYLALKLVLESIRGEPQPDSKYSLSYGEAGKIAEEYLAFFTGMNRRRPINTTYHRLKLLMLVQKPDYHDNDRTYEFKLCFGNGDIPFQYRKAYIQANISYYLTNEKRIKSDKDIIILELFVLSEGLIYLYHLKPDLDMAEAAIKKLTIFRLSPY